MDKKKEVKGTSVKFRINDNMNFNEVAVCKHPDGELHMFFTNWDKDTIKIKTELALSYKALVVLFNIVLKDEELGIIMKKAMDDLIEDNPDFLEDVKRSSDDKD